MSRRTPRTRSRVTRTGAREGARGLSAPPRDVGLSVRPRRPVRQKSPYPMMTIAIAIVGLSVIGWMLTWGGAIASDDPPVGTGASVTALRPDPERDPTPVFASEGDLQIHLAVDPTQLTALAFHQASGKNALHMTSLVPDADMTLAAELKAVPPVDEVGSPSDTIWGGICLRLWRSNRTGLPDTAADMGADPGSPVYSPVTGTVVQVRPYLLYEQHEDFEIHIRPDGRDDIEAVLIHIQDVRVKPGDKVKGGVTRIASVRKMSDKIEIQLGGYTANGGDHVHLQLNSVVESGESEPAGGS